MLVLIGSGGHGKVVLEALLASGVAAASVRVRDGSPDRWGSDLLGVKIEGPELDAGVADAEVHVAIGSAEARRRLYGEAEPLGARARTIVHPSARVSAFATIEAGVFAAAGAVVGPAARVGRGAILNHNSVVDHDCEIGAWCHIAPGTILGGGVRLGEGVLIGAGAAVLPGVSIGKDAVIGAGAVVTRAVGAGETWVGVPAAKTIGSGKN
ncbi:MAG TPA: NeuD/PglB/VioB family sugar acetyltransferase [Allosphingosinicella sp.]|uniref:NeuD/PglB/VioB family sugar acetyltransferase n=1 Tax=Allosphingosinicella sp. TaxID=2823234 RepID=UPI002EDB154B